MYKSDLEIAQAATIQHIKIIAAKIGITEDDLQYYGKNKAKLPLHLIDDEKVKKAKVELVEQKKRTGCPPKFKTEDAFSAAIDEYFKNCDSKIRSSKRR